MGEAMTAIDDTAELIERAVRGERAALERLLLDHYRAADRAHCAANAAVAAKRRWRRRHRAIDFYERVSIDRAIRSAR